MLSEMLEDLAKLAQKTPDANEVQRLAASARMNSDAVQSFELNGNVVVHDGTTAIVRAGSRGIQAADGESIPAGSVLTFYPEATCLEFPRNITGTDYPIGIAQDLSNDGRVWGWRGSYHAQPETHNLRADMIVREGHGYVYHHFKTMDRSERIGVLGQRYSGEQLGFDGREAKLWDNIRDYRPTWRGQSRIPSRDAVLEAIRSPRRYLQGDSTATA